MAWSRAVLSMVLLLPAGSALGEGPLPFALPSEAAARLEMATDRAQELRAGVGGGFEEALAASIRTDGGAAAPAPALAGPGPQDLERAEQLPQGVSRAVASLISAVRTANELLAPLSPADQRRAERAILDSFAAAGRTNLNPQGGVELAGLPALDLPDAATGVADRAPQAALLLGSALDRYLPAIQNWAGGVAGDGQGCDALDQRPLLCVGTTANNEYTDDVALLVDQGGNDTYLNSAGGAPIKATGDVKAISISIDRSGNDTYTAPVRTDDTGSYSRGQGTAVFGVGMLVDLEGDDVYSATVPDAATAPTGGSAIAQGFGAGGVGALFDLGGRDSYSVLGRDSTDDHVYTVGQGAGYLYGGTGLLVDRGRGDDRYELLAGTVDGLIKPYQATQFAYTRQVQGQGQAYLGTGILADDGGTDSLIALAGAKSHGGAYLFDPDYEPASPVYPKASVPIATIWAQGNGIFGGNGVVLAGDGPTRYESHADVEGIAQGNLLAQGHGIIGGQGALEDLSGDDRYEASVIAVDEEHYEVSDGCQCKPSAVFEPFISGVAAQGWGGAAAANGLLSDRGGNDSYLIAAHQRVEVTLEDAREAADSPARIDVTSYAPLFAGQGFATGDASGSLVDDAGTDSYTLMGSHHATADASRIGAGPKPDATLLSPFRPYSTGGQGGGRRTNRSAGVLMDLGGNGDRFDARSTYSMRTTPDPAGARRLGYTWPAFQGSGDGGIFAALGTAPVITSSPSQGVCAASDDPRGFGSWAECAAQGGDPDTQYFDAPAQIMTQSPDSNRFSFGRAPGASGIAPGLAMTSDTPSTAAAGSWLVPGARLTDSQGAPIRGATIRFDLQFALIGGVNGLERSWFNGWEVESVTGADGIARGGLPLDIATLDEITGDFPNTWTFRIMASFDGGPGLHPRRVAQSLQVT